MTPGFIPRPIAHLPWRIILLLSAITGFGCMVLYSSAGGHIRPWALNHGIRFGIFIVMALVISRFRPSFFARYALPGYAAILILLILVELIGGVAGGSQRWLDLGFFRLQPSELMKVMIILAVARFYALLPTGEIRNFTAIWPALVLIGLPFILVLVQPDLGTATTIAAGGIVVMFLAGLPLRLFIGAGTVFLALIPVVFAMLHDYQRNRVLTFLDPESDPLGTGYHISQSKIAIGSGGITGKGFLKGSQSHLDYLPEGHTDFVFATMAEEWGFIGGLLLILGFMLLFHWGLNVSRKTQDKFSRLTAAGLTTAIFFYVAVNLMMVMGLAPVVGIPLPFMSYGGSSMMTVMICIGIIFAIDRENRRKRRSGDFSDGWN